MTLSPYEKNFYMGFRKYVSEELLFYLIKNYSKLTLMGLVENSDFMTDVFFNICPQDIIDHSPINKDIGLSSQHDEKMTLKAAIIIVLDDYDALLINNPQDDLRDSIDKLLRVVSRGKHD